VDTRHRCHIRSVPNFGTIVIRVSKAELEHLVDAAAKVARDLTRITGVVRSGSGDAEVELSAAMVDALSLARRLRDMRTQAELNETPPTPRLSL
jgi:hypothetical protein